jgi:hypothetical protein
MALTKQQQTLLRMAYDSLYTMIDLKDGWWEDFDAPDKIGDAKLITDMLQNLAVLLAEHCPNEHEEFIIDAIEEMEFGSSNEECEEALEKSIRHNMKKIIGDADQLIETGDFLD